MYKLKSLTAGIEKVVNHNYPHEQQKNLLRLCRLRAMACKRNQLYDDAKALHLSMCDKLLVLLSIGEKGTRTESMLINNLM